MSERVFTLGEQIAELERELRLRRSVYPNHISRGMLKESEARWRVAALEAALATLRKLERAPVTGELDFGSPATPKLDPSLR